MQLLNRQEVCERLHISKNTYYKLLKKPNFPFVAIGRKLFVDADKLEAYLKR